MTDIHPDYGPAAQFSEHRKGDHIAYRQQKDWDKQPEPYSGEILWVCAATEKRGICYIVAPDIETGWIDHVYPGEVVAADPEQSSEEPTLVRCPHCGQLHLSAHVAQCPLNPRHPAS